MHLFLALLATLPQVPDLDPALQWGHWRGPENTGVAPQADPPLAWSEAENVRWKVELPGRGHSSPIVWGERVYLTTAVPVGDALGPRQSRMPGAHDNAPVTSEQEFQVLAFDRATGQRVWTRTVARGVPHDTAHVSGGYASASPITDGELVFAFFGSVGLFALDLEGVVAWSVDLGDMQVKHSHGEGAGPALHGDTLAVNWDHEGDSFLVTFDKRTGEERWRVERDEPTSWATPIVVEVGDVPQLIVPGSNRLRGYDLRDGRVIWECGGLSHNCVASPVHEDGVLIVGSSYEKQAMLAIELAGAKGDLTAGSENLLWTRRRRTPYVPSLLLYRGVIYNFQHYQPILCRGTLREGDEGPGPLRISGLDNLYASPVAAAGRVYLTDMVGTTLVIAAGPHDEPPEALAVNELEDTFSASAAVAGDALFLRGDRFLYCLAEDDAE